MRHKTPKWLEDIRSAADYILSAVAGKSLDEYKTDLSLRYSVERCFEIIGEAMGRIARFDPESAARIGDYPRIIAFRNVLIHGYDVLDHATVWDVIRQHLPVLRNQVEELLKEAENSLMPPEGENS